MTSARRGIAGLAVVRAGTALLVVVATGCFGSSSPGSTSRPLDFEYFSRRGENMIEQTVDISNYNSVPVVPVVRYIAVDAAGRSLGDIEVTTVYGSDTGGLVIPNRTTAIDILIFSGGDVSQVADVVATVRSSRVISLKLDDPSTDFEITPLADDGSVVTKFDPFVSMQIVNPYAGEVSVRVVCLQYNQPPDDETQQVTEVLQLTTDAEIEGGATTEVELDADAMTEVVSRGYGCASLKAHLVP